jgi:hypothetical protein
LSLPIDLSSAVPNSSHHPIAIMAKGKGKKGASSGKEPQKNPPPVENKPFLIARNK